MRPSALTTRLLSADSASVVLTEVQVVLLVLCGCCVHGSTYTWSTPSCAIVLILLAHARPAAYPMSPTSVTSRQGRQDSGRRSHQKYCAALLGISTSSSECSMSSRTACARSVRVASGRRSRGNIAVAPAAGLVQGQGKMCATPFQARWQDRTPPSRRGCRPDALASSIAQRTACHPAEQTANVSSLSHGCRASPTALQTCRLPNKVHAGRGDHGEMRASGKLSACAKQLTSTRSNAATCETSDRRVCQECFAASTQIRGLWGEKRARRCRFHCRNIRRVTITMSGSENDSQPK